MFTVAVPLIHLCMHSTNLVWHATDLAYELVGLTGQNLVYLW